ncbi:hypothetical protein [Blastopirellula marina]|uniref:Uncharacterized protein n=1 Tax=Blastopirellula marina TaxID=124 RepID=A0A2S8FHE1_9BACT|nr:hypothetical protein [Blastopirellula marina]PQO31577.1 hypothetical protein C5Y98_19350 [Blastopirellula marina]PTL42883.1 hypothetical protein C5Y97_19360 [Blastopirellula marina]
MSILPAIQIVRKNLPHLSLRLVLAATWSTLGCVPPTSPPEPQSRAVSGNEPSQTPASSDLSPSFQADRAKQVIVHQDANQSVQLLAITATLWDEGLSLDENDRIVGFKDRTQHVTWQMKLTVPGTYQVESDTICTGPTREARMRVRVGEDLSVEGLAELSDRPALLATSTLGEVSLETPGIYRVEVEMVGLPLVGKFAFAELRLVPTETESNSLPQFTTEEDSSKKP